ncbi:Electron transport complex protein RnfE [hydrothermal vent metagenome]|uniref:Electron transport complex protein RnfE n=1 Tax=hydrothermal vent metagenome TaxID=652676 RepID=A0A3B0Y9Y7_9ZZZZ
MPTLKEIAKEGLWNNNPALIQLLGLCPLLAVTSSFVNALGLGFATIVVLIGSNVVISAVRHWVRKEVRIPVFVLIIASMVTIIELLMQAFLYDLYTILGIFIPLIVTNCAIIGRAEAFASRNNVFHSALDGLMMGLGFTLVLVLLGSIREIIGAGTLFDQADLLFGEWGKNMKIVFIANYSGFLLAILPPGAFIGLGFIIAIKNNIDRKIALKSAQSVVVVTDTMAPTAK